MSALTPGRSARLRLARRELARSLNRLDIAENQSARDQAIALMQVRGAALRLAELAERYDVYLQGTYR